MRYGYHVRTADNGETSLEILTDEEIQRLIKTTQRSQVY